jgi:hypothetical protein
VFAWLRLGLCGCANDRFGRFSRHAGDHLEANSPADAYERVTDLLAFSGCRPLGPNELPVMLQVRQIRAHALTAR